MARVGSLVHKERVKTDEEAHFLGYVVCVVLLEHYLGAFMAQTSDDKLAEILAETWFKMPGIENKCALMLDLPSAVSVLLERSIRRLRHAH